MYAAYIFGSMSWKLMKVTKDYTSHGVVLEDLRGQKRTNFIQSSPDVHMNKYRLLQSVANVDNSLNYTVLFLETISKNLWANNC